MTRLRDTVGPLARSAEDIALLDEIMTGEKRQETLEPASVRIGVPKQHYWEKLDPEVEREGKRYI